MRTHFPNVKYCHGMYSKYLSQMSVRHSGSTDQPNLFLGEFDSAAPMLARHVGLILGMSTEKEMVGVDAKRIVAGMADKHFRRNRAAKCFKGPAVRGALAASKNHDSSIFAQIFASRAPRALRSSPSPLPASVGNHFHMGLQPRAKRLNVCFGGNSRSGVRSRAPCSPISMLPLALLVMVGTKGMAVDGLIAAVDATDGSHNQTLPQSSGRSKL